MLRRVCQQAEVQLLDETVSLARLHLRRDDRQQLRRYREYALEYSDTPITVCRVASIFSVGKCKM